MKTVGKLNLTTPSDTQIRLERPFSAPKALVFECYTRPDLIRRWMDGPPGWTMTACEFEPRVGGRYRYAWSGREGAVMGMSGEIREINPPDLIVSAELFDEDWTGGECINRVEFLETAGITTVVTTINFSSKQGRDGALATPMAEGMETGFEKIEGLLAESVG